MPLIPNRKGVTTEYKRGHFYLSHTVWDDGHEEIEIHRCAPKQLFHSYDGQEVTDAEVVLHSCDTKQFEDAFALFAALPHEVAFREIESGEVPAQGDSSPA